MKDEDVQNARASDKPWSFTESYVKPVMEMTKEVFAKIQKNTVGAVMNKIKKSLSSHKKPIDGKEEVSTPSFAEKVSSEKARSEKGGSVRR